MIRTFAFKTFARQGIQTFVTTRTGGVSPGPFVSFNLSFSTGDSKENVVKNRTLLADTLGIPTQNLISARQVHGTAVWQVQKSDRTPRKADILVTNQAGLTLLVLTADCVPIVLFDPEQRVIAAVHAGWRGTAARVAQVAVKTLVERFGCSANSVLVGIGPSIAQAHYEVGPEVVSAISLAVTEPSKILRPTKNGHAKLDLVGANLQQLQAVGVTRKQIEVLGLDTFSNPEQFYSARRQKPFGCFGTGILLQQ